MALQIRTKDLTLDAQQKEYLESVIERFEKYSLDITRIVVNIFEEKKGVHVEFELHIAHTKPIVVNEIDEHFKEAVDRGAKRVQKALRRLHDKLKSPKHESLRTILNEIDD